LKKPETRKNLKKKPETQKNLKPERNPKNPERNLKKTRKKSIYKTRWALESNPKPDGFG
jgi:hypothetical protein